MSKRKPDEIDDPFPEDDSSDILAFIKKFGIVDKDRSANIAKNRGRKSPSGISKVRGKLRLTIDLHGLKSTDAGIRLRNAFEQCRNRGVTQLLIIHGQGLHSSREEGPVLKSMVRDMLENECRSYVRSFGPASAVDGGDGATIVFLR